MFMTACSCKLVLPACWPHAGMQLRLPASSSCHVCGFSACLVRVGNMSRHVLYVMFTQDLDLRWHVYDGLLVQACLTGMLASRGYAVTCCLRRLPAMFVVSRHV